MSGAHVCVRDKCVEPFRMLRAATLLAAALIGHRPPRGARRHLATGEEGNWSSGKPEIVPSVPDLIVSSLANMAPVF